MEYKCEQQRRVKAVGLYKRWGKLCMGEDELYLRCLVREKRGSEHVQGSYTGKTKKNAVY